jgi:hypothetical protein
MADAPSSAAPLESRFQAGSVRSTRAGLASSCRAGDPTTILWGAGLELLLTPLGYTSRCFTKNHGEKAIRLALPGVGYLDVTYRYAREDHPR